MNLIHQKPLFAGRVIASVLTESHGSEVLAKQLKANPRVARALIETMLADQELGPMVRERCSAHLASKPHVPR